MSKADRLKAKVDAWADKDRAVNAPIEDLSWVTSEEESIEQFNAQYGVDVEALSEKYALSTDEVMGIIESGQEL